MPGENCGCCNKNAVPGGSSSTSPVLKMNIGGAFMPNQSVLARSLQYISVDPNQRPVAEVQDGQNPTAYTDVSSTVVLGIPLRRIFTQR